MIKLNVDAAKRASPAPTPSTNLSAKESIGKKALGFSANRLHYIHSNKKCFKND